MRKLIFLMIAVVAAIVVIGPMLGAVSPTYSDGDRVGVVTKFSHKGMIFKSFEGELNMGGFKTVTVEDNAGTNVNSVVGNVFEFSVRDEGIGKQITEAMESGKRVKLHYDESMFKPYDLSTGYVVNRVEILKQ